MESQLEKSRQSALSVEGRRGLVIFPGALGDFICFLPALERISRCGPVDLLARSEYAVLVPPAVKTRSLECHEIARLFVAGAAKDQRLKDFFSPYLFIYSWMGSLDQDCVSNLQALSSGDLRIFPFRPFQSGTHMTDYYLSCLREGHPEETLPVIPLKSDAVAWRDRFWRRCGLEGKKVLALGPGSGAKEKNWPVEFFHAVAEWWEKEYGRKVLVILGPVEEGRRAKEDFWTHGLVVQGLGLGQLVALLARCDLYLGNDSGVTHLAAALGVKTIALFGPTSLEQWVPRGNKVTVVARGVECSPCLPPVMKGCPHRKCLTAISPREVIGLLERSLDKGNKVDFDQGPFRQLGYSHSGAGRPRLA